MNTASIGDRLGTGKAAWLAATALVTGLLSAPLAAQATDAPATPEAAPPTVQSPATAAPADAQAGGDIVVTGSRVAVTGFSAPSAVSVLSSQAIQQQTRTTVADVLQQEPAFRATRSKLS